MYNFALWTLDHFLVSCDDHNSILPVVLQNSQRQVSLAEEYEYDDEETGLSSLGSLVFELSLTST